MAGFIIGFCLASLIPSAILFAVLKAIPATRKRPGLVYGLPAGLGVLVAAVAAYGSVQLGNQYAMEAGLVAVILLAALALIGYWSASRAGSRG
jgi:hypothetical protein